ncbi:MAG: class I SAM-dependent methyltransferase [Candidatus Marinimicrobia bacterium]|jgi:SAM-dependent methyltransferase|nr:class I SAM-dependent methyltransferase [Candidatus Neomarinimicrobiota bacterium]MBT3497088.1 class I SAM-dependent methyltransferase [Candidatus Neomarinimicrobiota bacterium]MBT3691923.1 class I SAM-dependent methyltransferase [Candidatus Neomarinimicrobiota bacterium]MBT3732046.1 class I SAM-dependent methyltransferase [Candidatus Neomarinimicrobiota bacterium]MBT4144218.1 class I SAM-dependent methyltransferase [Candidatus Neomarinimicrobiota bacterium]
MSRNIYSEPALYDAVNWWKNNDVAFITGLADEINGSVLELAAGTGRLGLEIMAKGHSYLGVDSSQEYVDFANQKIQSKGYSGKVVLGDMRNFSLGKKFDFIFIGFNSFFHLLNNKEAFQCLESVFDHLSDGGKFLIDLFIPDPSFLYKDDTKLYHVTNFTWPEDGLKGMVKERNHYEAETQINHIYWYFYKTGIDEASLFEFDMHMIFPDTMDRLLCDAGFTILNKYGDHDKSPFNEESDYQIYVCEK